MAFGFGSKKTPAFGDSVRRDYAEADAESKQAALVAADSALSEFARTVEETLQKQKAGGKVVYESVYIQNGSLLHQEDLQGTKGWKALDKIARRLNVNLKYTNADGTGSNWIVVLNAEEPYSKGR